MDAANWGLTTPAGCMTGFRTYRRRCLLHRPGRSCLRGRHPLHDPYAGRNVTLWSATSASVTNGSRLQLLKPGTCSEESRIHPMMSAGFMLLGGDDYFFFFDWHRAESGYLSVSEGFAMAASRWTLSANTQRLPRWIERRATPFRAGCCSGKSCLPMKGSNPLCRIFADLR